MEIDVWQGEIAELEVDALVVSANESLFMTAGAAASIKRLGGEEIERAAVEQAPVAPGSAVATHAGALAATYVIHAVAVGHDRVAHPDRLLESVRAVLSLAEPLQLRRVATALLGVEHGVFSVEDSARLLLEGLGGGDVPLDSVVIATANTAETRAVSQALAQLRAEAR